MSIEDHKSNFTTTVLRVMEGQIEAASLINKAYIKNNFENITVISGINFYPFKIDMGFFTSKVSMEESAIILPICLCLGMPVYMYRLVLEKE